MPGPQGVLLARRYSWGGAAIVARGDPGDPAARRLLVTDDGVRWTDISPSGLRYPVESFDFIDRAHGWVGTFTCGNVDGDLLITSDGGNHWSTVAHKGSHGCHAGAEAAFDFVDSRDGTLTTLEPTGPGSHLERTSDGGLTWRSIGQLPAVSEPSFWDPFDGWVSLGPYVQTGGFAVTHDGGSTWVKHSLPLPVGESDNNATYQTPAFYDSRRGTMPVSYATAGHLDIAFFGSIDAGNHWTLGTRVSTVSPVGDPAGFGRLDVAVSMPQPGIWWILTRNSLPSVYVTSDGGQTWHTVGGLPAGASGSITAVDGLNAWVTTTPAASVGSVYATADGGSYWRQLMP